MDTPFFLGPPRTRLHTGAASLTDVCGQPGVGRAFTLLEVMVAVMIIAMLALTLNRFVVSNLTALRISSEASSERMAMIGLVNLLQTQLTELPSSGPNRLLGQPHKFGEFSSDTLDWVAKAGAGVLTSAAVGDYRVSLELKPIEKSSSVLELGLRRRQTEGPGSTAEEKESWVPLMSPVKALEIRFFHPQLNAKVDRWNDGNSLPSLVYVSIQRNADEPPYEAVLTVPSANLQK